MGVRDNRQLSFVCFVNDGLNFLHRHLVLVDELDYINATISECAYFGSCIFCSLHSPTEIFGSGIWLVLDKGAGNIHCWPGNLALLNTVAHGGAGLEWTAKIASTCYAGEQELFRRGRHDHGFHLRWVGFVPVGVVAVSVDH